ncbi:MAG: hypothetical protein EOO38_01170 [Cytophagaceae bacterium]|nr:MAG: hypothetical protein EOO38_01170 [Cytophagaceae bacterium]
MAKRNMNAKDVKPGKFFSLGSLEQQSALVEARKTLRAIEKAPDLATMKQIDKVMLHNAPNLPKLLTVLDQRRILDVLSLPDPSSSSAIAPPAHELLKVGARVLGATNRSVKDTAERATKRARITRVEDGANLLAASTGGIREPGTRTQVQRHYLAVGAKAQPERDDVEKTTKAGERALDAKIWERLCNFDPGAKRAFKALEPGAIKKSVADRIMKTYLESGNSAARYAFIEAHPHFRVMLQHACPAITWTHHTLHDLDVIVNGNGTLQQRVRDVLIHTESGDWPETKQFKAGGRVWIVRYHKRRAEDSRVFSAETSDVAGNKERVILWYGTGRDLPHNVAGYNGVLQNAIEAFQAQLGGTT